MPPYLRALLRPFKPRQQHLPSLRSLPPQPIFDVPIWNLQRTSLHPQDAPSDRFSPLDGSPRSRRRPRMAPSPGRRPKRGTRRSHPTSRRACREGVEGRGRDGRSGFGVRPSEPDLHPGSGERGESEGAGHGRGEERGGGSGGCEGLERGQRGRWGGGEEEEAREEEAGGRDGQEGLR
jgi:hypothetical protein